MNLTLLKKELAGLRFCILLIMVIYIIYSLLSGFPDPHLSMLQTSAAMVGCWIGYWSEYLLR